jgi:uncharacterized OsmC-like protein
MSKSIHKVDSFYCSVSTMLKKGSNQTVPDVTIDDSHRLVREPTL